MLLVEAFHVVIDQLDPSHPFDALFAEQAGRKDADRVAVAHGSGAPFMPYATNVVGSSAFSSEYVSVYPSAPRSTTSWLRFEAQQRAHIAQRQTCPDRIAHEPSAEIVADAHERCFLRGGWQRANVA